MKFAGPGELDVTLGAPADLGGKKFTVQNADGTRVDFFPAAQATGLGNYFLPSIFDGAVAISPTSSYESATSDYILGGRGGFLGWFVFRNPGPVPVDLVSWTAQLGFYAGHQTSTSILPGGTYVVGADTLGVAAWWAPRYRYRQAVPSKYWNYSSISTRWSARSCGHIVSAMPPAAVTPIQLAASPPVLSWTWQAGAHQPAAQAVTITWGLTVPPQVFTVALATSAGGTCSP